MTALGVFAFSELDREKPRPPSNRVGDAILAKRDSRQPL